MQNFVLNSLQDDSSLKKAPIKKRRLTFTKEEDSRLSKAVEKYGEDNWELVALYVGNRTRRQCSERWRKFLSPTVNLSKWTEEEDKLLIEKFKEIGPKWSQISHFFNNRTDVNIKARFVVLQRKAKKHQEFIEKVKLFSIAAKKTKPMHKTQNNITIHSKNINNININLLMNTCDSARNTSNNLIDLFLNDKEFTYNQDINHKKQYNEMQDINYNFLTANKEANQNINVKNEKPISNYDGRNSTKSIFDDNFDFSKYIISDSPSD